MKKIKFLLFDAKQTNVICENILHYPDKSQIEFIKIKQKVVHERRE